MTAPAAPAPLVAIRVLGPLEVDVAGAPIVVDTRKALAILALLAVEGRAFAREELAALLWPDSDDESARGALRRTLSVLRAALGDRGISVDRSTVALDPIVVAVDLATVRAALAADDVDPMIAALPLLRGPLLAGFGLRDSLEFDDWRATQAVAAERLAANLLDRLGALAEVAGDDATAMAAASRRVGLDPLDEAGHRRLMRLLARSGDRAGAIRQYRACVGVLERELGVGPLSETTALYEAIRDADPTILRHPIPAAAPPAPAAGAPDGPVALPLVGREAELGALLAAHEAAVPDGRLALVSGEAGIGKTRLAEALAAAVRARGGVALTARAYATEASIPYGPVVELLRAGLALPDARARLSALAARDLAEIERLVPLGGPARPGDTRPEDPAAARIRLLEALADTLTTLAAGPRRSSPGLLAVEDLQWADDATRETLAYLARRLAGRPLLVLLTWRPEDLDDRGLVLTGALASLPGAVAVPLRRLDRAAVATLVAALPAAARDGLDVDAVLEESEGVPLYLVEALAAGPHVGSPGASEAVRGFRALLRDRVSSVGETAAQVLAAAAVLGRDFDLDAVRATSGRSDDEVVIAIEELLRRGIVRERAAGNGAGYDFAHGKLREAADEATSLARRRLLHRRAADWIRSDPTSARDAGRLAQLARHERAAGRDAEAAEAFRAAGALARAVFANREALGHLESALALGHPDAIGLMLEIGELRTALADYAAAAAILEAAAAVAPPAELPRIELLLGRIRVRRGDVTAAASHLDAAIDGLRAAGPGPILARAIVDRGLVAHRMGDPAGASARAEEALGLADATGDPRAISAAHRLLGMLARERGDFATARAHLESSLAAAAAGGDPVAAIAAENVLALVEAAAGDREAAIERLGRALDGCRGRGLLHLEAALENNLADQLHAAGRRDEAMAHLKVAVARFAEVDARPGELEPEIWKLVEW